MTDYASESVSRPRIPQDKFEAEVFRRLIQADTQRWYQTDTLKIRVSESPDETGAYELYIWEPSDDLLCPESKGAMSGKVWLAEKDYPATEAYRVQVWHEIEGQRANHGFPPVPHWLVAGGR